MPPTDKGTSPLIHSHLRQPADTASEIEAAPQRRPPATEFINRSVNWRAREAIRIISADFHNPRLQLNILAEHLAVSPAHLCRVIRKVTGFSFRHHLHAARTIEAARLLCDTSLSVKEVAARTGYTNTSRLDRYFKARFGALPRQFRNSARSIDRREQRHV